MATRIALLIITVLFYPCSLVSGETDPNDFAVLIEFRKGLTNPQLLKWPETGDDPCGPPLWPHVFCSGFRVTQIQVQNLGLSGRLPNNFNQLSKLENLGFQRNNFSGPLPSFSGLSNLQYAYLVSNQFDTIPSDFFSGLTSLLEIALDQNPLNQSSGWSIPRDLQASTQLRNLSLIQCNVVGELPDFLGTMPMLTALKLSYNTLSGELPASFAGLMLEILWLNNQDGAGISGGLDVLTTMASLTDAWLHGNGFSGPIPPAIGACTSLTRLWLNNNNLVGLIPRNLITLPRLQSLKLENNKLMGPIPDVKIANFTYSSNSFCESAPGVPCSLEVTALLEFLAGVNYPLKLASSWGGNDPCAGFWEGVSCSGGKVSVINLPNFNLSGSISPSLGELDSLVDVRLGGNNLSGSMPANLTDLKMLRLINVSANNLVPPVPKFSRSVTLLTDGNPLLKAPSSLPPSLPPSPTTTISSPTEPVTPETPNSGKPSSFHSSTSIHHNGSAKVKSNHFDKLKIMIIVAVVVVLLILILILLIFVKRRGKKDSTNASTSVVVHPKDSSDSDNRVKLSVIEASQCSSSTGSMLSRARSVEEGNLTISVQLLRSSTKNFAPENVVGRGGFGVVYKGTLHDGMRIAVKRMEADSLSNKALDEFQAEIAVLSRVRHRNLVCLLGYSIEGSERLLVYEYLPKGALSKHLFQWRKLCLEPLSWKKRLNIALDVARGMEYLHSLTKECFIHRDLKSSNILLDDDYRAKVSDFGLVKLAPNGNNSVVTKLAGTFGYLAPEYAVTGKITTKADVYSFGVVLMELITGMAALDDDRPEETRYLASWFAEIKSDKEKLRDAVDSALGADKEEIFNSISTVADLAGHCAAREPYKRPEMGYAVNVLASLANKWKPCDDEQEVFFGVDLQKPLIQLVKIWQDDETSCENSLELDDNSKGSIPAKPAGFAESFTSADGR
ncbi:putative receptor protein kinase TMK1 [Apostasia shenzhenica]|uniref:Putative receptor protein kinase TMK1 n=1 Tax=Apostasia shenzhenica TaxID=1088818 RepID=A0A2I0AW49_9ASPA|nr:putative receptor protein kinase TMK1 [Apostasia shenzhenica]